MALERHYHIVDIAEITGLGEKLIHALLKAKFIDAYYLEGEVEPWISHSTLTKLVDLTGIQSNTKRQVRCTLQVDGSNAIPSVSVL